MKKFQGADTAVFKCLSKSGEMYKNKSMVHLNNFARAGYRTLCYAYANISESFYNVWKDEYLKASAVLINRDTAKNKVAEKIERKLILIGVTATENKLKNDVRLFNYYIKYSTLIFYDRYFMILDFHTNFYFNWILYFSKKN